MLIDTHCHLTSAGLVERIDEVLAAARAAGVTRCVLVAVNAADAEAALELMATRPELYLVAGVHPHEAAQCDGEKLARLNAVLGGEGVAADVAARIVGIGETGLDFYYDFAPPARQEEVLEAHLGLAVERGLPVVIHAREAELRVCEIIARFPDLAGRFVFHCFSGDPDVARRILDLGGYCSFTGVVTFRKSQPIQESARFVPADRLMVETDAPYLSPEPMRKIRPNEPALLVHTARFLAELRNEDFAALAATTTANANRFFSLPEDDR
jgi:TatD DNase family protein